MEESRNKRKTEDIGGALCLATDALMESTHSLRRKLKLGKGKQNTRGEHTSQNHFNLAPNTIRNGTNHYISQNKAKCCCMNFELHIIAYVQANHGKHVC